MILIMAGYVLIMIYELPELIKKDQKKEIVVFFGLMFISAFFAVIISNGIEIPRGIQYIRFFFEKVLGWTYA